MLRFLGGKLCLSPGAVNVSVERVSPHPELFPALWEALREGLAHPVGGEVVIRQGDGIGRIYLYKGAVAWVNCSRLRVHVRDTLLTHSGIAPEELEAALQEAQQARKHFAETLLDWGLIDREQLRRCLGVHTAQHLGAICRFEGAPQVLFVPLVRTYAAGLLFPLKELLDTWVQLEATAGGHPEEAPEDPPGPKPRCALGHTTELHPALAERLAQRLPPRGLAGALLDMDAHHICAHAFRLQGLGSDTEGLLHWLMDVLAGRISGQLSVADAPGARGTSRSLPHEVCMIAEDTIHVLRRSAAHPSVYFWGMFDSAATIGGAMSYCHLTLRELEREFLGGT